MIHIPDGGRAKHASKCLATARDLDNGDLRQAWMAV
jgi:hypothetical protein